MVTTYSPEVKRQALLEIIANAVEEQRNPRRDTSPFDGTAFESRINETEWRERLAFVLKMTDALEVLAEMVGAIDEEVQ